MKEFFSSIFFCFFRRLACSIFVAFFSKKGCPFGQPYEINVSKQFGNYLIISLTVPAPTVLPPSRMENLVPFSIATG